MTTSRRGFLSLLVAAPFAMPAVVKAAAAERYAMGGYVGRAVFGVVGEKACDFPLVPKQIQALQMSIDTTDLRSRVDTMVRLEHDAMPVVCATDDDPHDLFMLDVK